MKGEARLIMGATLVMAVSLVLVLGLVIVLLAELYCSLLHRRRQRELATSSNTCSPTEVAAATTTTTGSPFHQPQPQSPTAPSLSSFYAQAVLRAPRNIIFPAVSEKPDIEKQLSSPLQSQSRRHCLFTSSPSPMFTPLGSPEHVEKSHFQEIGAAHLVYISNPMYDGNEGGGGRPSREDNTPFETPDSSPSKLETGDDDDDDDDDDKEKLSITSSPNSSVPVTPMKKLPAEACSVSLRDARSLCTSDSDSNMNNASSSTSATPCTSPSW